MGFMSDILPWIAPGLDHPATAAPKERPAMPTVEQVQQSFAFARQRQVPHIDSDFAQSAVENLRAEMQQAVDDAAERSSAGASAPEVAQSGFDTPSAPTSQVSKLVAIHIFIGTPEQYFANIKIVCLIVHVWQHVRSTQCLAWREGQCILCNGVPAYCHLHGMQTSRNYCKLWSNNLAAQTTGLALPHNSALGIQHQHASSAMQCSSMQCSSMPKAFRYRSHCSASI